MTSWSRESRSRFVCFHHPQPAESDMTSGPLLPTALGTRGRDINQLVTASSVRVDTVVASTTTIHLVWLPCSRNQTLLIQHWKARARYRRAGTWTCKQPIKPIKIDAKIAASTRPTPCRCGQKKAWLTVCGTLPHTEFPNLNFMLHFLFFQFVSCAGDHVLRTMIFANPSIFV